MALSVSPRARDLHINLSNSCNCCCWRRNKIDTKTQVYIDSTGSVVEFDPSFALSQIESNRRCIRNLKLHIQELTIGTGADPQETFSAVESIAGTPLSEEEPPPITLDLVTRINTALRRALPLPSDEEN